MEDRTPELIVQPVAGTIYTGSSAKVAEHGGFAEPDTHVAMLVVKGSNARARLNPSPVTTRQIAPTILQDLGLNPNALEAVQQEHTTTLP